MAAEAAARGSVLVATLEQHVARAEAALRREEAAALRLRLELATLPPGEQEERLRSFLTSSHLGALEQLAAVSFLPSLGTLHLGVLLTGTSGTMAAPPEHRVAVVTVLVDRLLQSADHFDSERMRQVGLVWTSGLASD